MKKNPLLFTMGASLILLGCVQSTNLREIAKEKFTVCSDKKAAIASAVAAWLPVFGEKVIVREMPFVAQLNGEVWTVDGTLNAAEVGGVAHALVRQKDCTVIDMYHDK